MAVLMVCSDLHGSDETLSLLRKAERAISPDLVVASGDLTTYGSADYLRRFLANFSADILAVPGNCDTDEMLLMLEDAGVSVHGRRVKKAGLDIFGFGGGLPSSASMPFEVDEEDIVTSLRSVASRGGVMVTHTPPKGMNDSDRSGRHLGSEGIMQVVTEFRPRLVLSGHVHEARGSCVKGGTMFVNPGPARGGYYAKVELGEEVDVQLF
jgi:Icc-related predicted phosphoesterase